MLALVYQYTRPNLDKRNLISVLNKTIDYGGTDFLENKNRDFFEHG